MPVTGTDNRALDGQQRRGAEDRESSKRKRKQAEGKKEVLEGDILMLSKKQKLHTNRPTGHPTNDNHPLAALTFELFLTPPPLPPPMCCVEGKWAWPRRPRSYNALLKVRRQKCIVFQHRTDCLFRFISHSETGGRSFVSAASITVLPCAQLTHAIIKTEPWYFIFLCFYH